MTSWVTVMGGVDTHKHNTPPYSTRMDACSAPTSSRHLLAWTQGFGQVQTIGVESTGSFGATLTRFLTAVGAAVAEVNRPNPAAAGAMASPTDSMPSRSLAPC